MPNEPAHTPNVLSIGRPVAADEFVPAGNLIVSPDGLILKEITYVAELVPLLIDHVLSLIIHNTDAIDHTTTLVLIDEDLSDAFRRVD